MRSNKRKRQLLQTALELAAKSHYRIVSFSDIAAANDVSTALVKFYFKNREQLQIDILQLAIDTECDTVIKQGTLLEEITWST